MKKGLFELIGRKTIVSVILLWMTSFVVTAQQANERQISAHRQKAKARWEQLKEKHQDEFSALKVFMSQHSKDAQYLPDVERLFLEHLSDKRPELKSRLIIAELKVDSIGSSTAVTASESASGMLKFKEGSTISHLMDGRENMLGNGAIHRWAGSVGVQLPIKTGDVKMYRFIGDENDPLTFGLIYEVGWVYLHGIGKVILPDGKEVVANELKAVADGERVQEFAAKVEGVIIDAGKTGEPISKFVYGQFIEHLGRCIYGGIWAEMLEDRKFYFPITAEYDPYRGTRSVSKDSPFAVVGASPWQIMGPADSVSMVREGSFVGEHTPLIKPGGGIRQLDLGLVKNKKYVGYIYLKPQRQNTNVLISLLWGDKTEQKNSIQTLVVANNYGKYPFKFTAGGDTVKGKLQIEVSDSPCFVGTVSLMPADNIEGMRTDTLELLKELNAPMYRWPGGNFVSGYDWRDGIGDRDRRPPRRNPAWTGAEHNDFGFNEFIRFCRLVKAEPLVTVNTGFGDAYSAAAQLEYSNGSTDTLMGAARANNGMPEPFGVRYWAIGNEMFGRWQLGYMSLNHYVRKHNWVVDKMREVDPDIVPIASGNAGEWSEGLLKNCTDHIDMIAEHFYCQEKPDLVEHTSQIADNIKRKVEFHKQLRKKLDVLEGKDIRIAMTEWNYWYGRHEFGELGTRYFHKDGLGIAKGLHEYFRNSDIIFLANYAQTVNVIGCIKTSKTAAAFETTGLVLKLYRNEFGTVPLTIAGDVQPLDIAAAWTSDRNALTIGIVNPTKEQHALAMDLKGAQLTGSGKLWLIAHSDPMAYNEPGEEPKVAIEEKPVTGISNKLNVPPLSISLYKLATKN